MAPPPVTPSRASLKPGPAGASPGALCTASASYKKKAGVLTLTKKALSWTPSAGGVAALEFSNARINSLFSSKEGGPKVMLRVGVLPSIDSPAGTPEEAYTFAFTEASSAVSDREHFKRELVTFVERNRQTQQNQQAKAVGDAKVDKGKGKAVDGAETNSDKAEGSKDKGKAVDPLQDWKIKKRVLVADPELKALHKELVMGNHISEAEFWEGREDLLLMEAQLEAQRRGRSAQMVDLRTEADGGEIHITPQIIHDTFEQYPIVQKAYAENVPPLTDQTFWARYLVSKLYHRNRSSSRQIGDSAKPDEIFDKYLEDEDDNLEPKQMGEYDVHRLLDLAATEEDHGETGNARDWTMRGGAQKSSLPLMRRFNQHSERLLDTSLGKPQQAKRSTIDAGDAGARNLYDSIVLEDLETATASDRILLDAQGQERYFEGASGSGDGTGIGMKRKRSDEEKEDLKRRVGSWEGKLADFTVDAREMENAERDLMENIRVRWGARHGSKDNTLPADVLAALTSLHSATTEFLRHFWSAMLPPRPGDISAAASATPTQKAAKAQRMLGYLARTEERVAKAVEDAREQGISEARVREVVANSLAAVDKARQYYRERGGK